ncbi:MAG: 3-deoxy-7-phosphoheptulonate synthase [Phycisphaerae bacterium]
MVVVMRSDASEEQIRAVIDKIEDCGMDAHVSKGTERTIIGLVGDERQVDFDSIAALAGVERAMPILRPYKYVSRNVHPETIVTEVGGVSIGKDLVFMAGPCSVEDEDTTLRIADAVKQAGARIFRGGAYKPRTSPWSFQGLREEGLKILSKVRDETGLPIVTEIMDAADIEVVGEHADIYQVGMRNMRNYTLLSELGNTSKPVLLKRGDSATIEEWLAAADYIFRNGNHDVILCERGIRTFENYTRNTLDLSAIPAAKGEACLPVFADPSHGTGRADLVEAMSRAAVAAGADGLLLEAHVRPEKAWSDGKETITPDGLKRIIESCGRIREQAGS